MKLTELNPQFVKYEARPDGKFLVHVDNLAEAHGIQFDCPKCNADDRQAHRVEVSFSGAAIPEGMGSVNSEGKPSRWFANGTGYEDLTLGPSI